MLTGEVQRLYDTGRYLGCIRAVEAALPEATGQERLELLWLAGKAALHLSMWRQAVGYLTTVAEDARTERGARATVNLAYALIEYGEPGEAERLLLSLLSDATLTPAIRAEALHNLGLSYERRRQYQQATEVYNQAADAYLSVGRRTDALSSLQNAAFMAMVEGTAGGNHLLHRAQRLAEHGTEILRAHLVALCAYHAWQSGRNHDAILGAEELLQPDHVHATDWDRALAGFVAARVAAAEGQLSIARTLASKAQSWAVASRDIRLMNLTNTLNDLNGEV